MNVAVFFVGPYIGAFAYELDGFLDERALSSSLFHTFVEGELVALGMNAEAYELRFNFSIAQYAPTFISTQRILLRGSLS